MKSYLKFVHSWFRVSRVIAWISIGASLIALIVMRSLQLDITNMLLNLALNLAALWLCEAGMEKVAERLQEEEKKK